MAYCYAERRNDHMSENIVGTKQAAEMLGVSISTIYRMVDQGILQPSKTPGGQRRFSVNQLEEYKEKSRGIVAPQNPYQKKLQQIVTMFSLKLRL